jgi:signal transduction histidine kinase
MHSLLAVPVDCRGPFRGNLYVSDKLGAREFSLADAETLQRFATQVAIAIDNHFVNRRLRELAVAEERARIARDLHDGTAQILAYVKTKAQAVREYLDAGREDRARADLDELAAAAREVLTDVREDILGLRAAGASGGALAASLDGILTVWKEQARVDTELRCEPQIRLPPERELQLLRIVQEALANVRKHAHATRVEVTVEGGPEGLRTTIQDDGTGFDPAAPPAAGAPRLGLQTMRERAEMLGGALRVDSQPGGPTRVTITMPP